MKIKPLIAQVDKYENKINLTIDYLEHMIEQETIALLNSVNASLEVRKVITNRLFDFITLLHALKS